MSRIALGLCVLLAASGCGRGCGCVEGDKTYEVLEGHFRVEFVRSVRWGGGRLPGPMTDCEIRIHANPVRSVPVECREVELQESPDGTLVTFRHDARSPWTLLRLGRTDHVFVDCGAPIGRGPTPDWSRVEPLPQAAPRIVACEENRPGFPRSDAISRLAAELRGSGGAGAVATFLADSAASTSIFGSSDEWLGERSRLPEPERQAVDARLCAAFGRPETPPPAFVLGARLCPHDAPLASAAALTRLRAGFAAPARDDLATDLDPILEWSAIVALAGEPAGAAEAACAFLSRPGMDLRPQLARLVIAAAHAHCPAILAELATDPCRGDPSCGDALCTAEQIDREIAAWRSPALVSGARPLKPTRPDSGHVFLAALYAQGPIPEDFAVRHGRRRYQIDLGSGPPCRDRTAPDAPCTCDQFVRAALCEAPRGAPRWVYRSGNCSLRIDDERREVGDVRVACLPPGSQERCRFDMDCCSGLVCRPGSGDGTCVQPPPPADGGASRGPP